MIAKRIRAFFARSIRALIAKTPYRLVHCAELELKDRALAAVGEAHLNAPVDDGSVRAIVFSRDRPLQLHALLSGYFDCFDDPPPVRVMYSVSGKREDAAYEELNASFSNRNLQLIRETNFRDDLLEQLEAAGSGRVFFLVDDIVFLEPIAVSDLKAFPVSTHVLSLRLAPRIDFSYTTQKSQRRPELRDYAKHAEKAGGLSRPALEWDWASGEIDWAYAFSVDGHVFRAREIFQLAKSLHFRAPNSFESAMQAFAPFFAARKGICYERPALVNIPCNRVQTELDNIHGSMHQHQLLELWEAGQRVDFRSLYGAQTNSCHQEMLLPLESDDTAEKSFSESPLKSVD